MPRIDNYDLIGSVADDDLLLISDTSASNTTNSVEISSLASHINIGKQNQLTLTTTGTSGAATLTGATLNIPQYSSGVVGSGTVNTIAMFTPDGTTIGDSPITRTGSGSIQIGGNLTIGQFSYLYWGSNSSDRLSIQNGISGSTIRQSGSGDLLIQCESNIELKAAASGGGTEALAKFKENGPIELYYDNVKTFETTSAGITVTGTQSSFTGQVTIPTTPVANTDAASKAYVDSQAGPTSLNGLTDASTIKGGFNGGNNTENLILGPAATNLPNLDTTSSLGGNIILQSSALSNPTSLSSGYRNHLIGLGTGTSLTTGNSNVAIGTNALNDSVTGNGSVAIGTNALGLNTKTSTTHNTAVGSGAAVNSTTGEKITSIGASSGYLSFPGTGSNITTIGYGAVASTSSVSNEITLGNSSVTALRCAVTSITSLSDERDKKDITDLEYGLDFIESLQPKQFVWDNRTETAITKDEEGNDVTEEIHSANKGKKDFGFIAQDVQTLDNDILRLVYDENPDKLEISYGKLVPILVKAVKELSDKVKALEV